METLYLVIILFALASLVSLAGMGVGTLIALAIERILKAWHQRRLG